MLGTIGEEEAEGLLVQEEELAHSSECNGRDDSDQSDAVEYPHAPSLLVPDDHNPSTISSALGSKRMERSHIAECYQRPVAPYPMAVSDLSVKDTVEDVIVLLGQRQQELEDCLCRSKVWGMVWGMGMCIIPKEHCFANTKYGNTLRQYVTPLFYTIILFGYI